VTGGFELAQTNIARPRAPLTDPRLRGFVRRLDGVNALAESSPGFVWRLQTYDGNSVAVPVFDDASLIITLSVWRSVEELRAFVYTGFHAEVMQRRREWFEHFAEAYTVAWWIPAGTRPTVADAEQKLVRFRENGGGPDAFSLTRSYPPPS
jgi:heme-degrading monooxygenase HmoA